jgi:hypothetical protein
MDNVAANSDAGKPMPLGVPEFEEAEREQQAMRWNHFDLIITVDCGLEFGPT